DALVDSIVMSAEHHQVSLGGEVIGDGLVERRAVGRHENDFIVGTGFLQLLDAGGKWLDLQHNTASAAVGVIVYISMLVVGVVAQVVHNNFAYPLFLGALQNGMCKGTFQQARQHRDDIKPHVRKLR